MMRRKAWLIRRMFITARISLPLLIIVCLFLSLDEQFNGIFNRYSLGNTRPSMCGTSACLSTDHYFSTVLPVLGSFIPLLIDQALTEWRQGMYVNTHHKSISVIFTSVPLSPIMVKRM